MPRLVLAAGATPAKASSLGKTISLGVLGGQLAWKTMGIARRWLVPATAVGLIGTAGAVLSGAKLSDSPSIAKKFFLGCLGCHIGLTIGHQIFFRK